MLILLSGCIEQTPSTQCGNEGLVVMDYNVNPVEVLPGYTATITFWLENRGEADAENVEVNFFDLQGLEVVDILCEGGTRNEMGCLIPKIVGGKDCLGDKKKFSATLKVPENKGIMDNPKISFSIIYRYAGSSEMNFRIYKPEAMSKLGTKIYSSTKGPLRVEINPDFLLRRIEDNGEQTVTEWLEEGQHFTVKVNFIRTTATQDSEINLEDLRIDYQYIEPASEGRCDFIGGRPNKPLDNLLEEPLVCDMIASNINQEWVLGSIKLDYSYAHKMRMTQDFNIKQN